MVPPISQARLVVKPTARHVMCASVETVQVCTTMRAFRGQTVRLIGTIGLFRRTTPLRMAL